MTERPIAVVDIDGVLADARHREHLVASRPKDWDAFFAAVGQDPVLEPGRERLRALAVAHEVVLVSGRPERCRADTESWLERHGMGGLRLVLRPEADRRAARVLKAELVAGLGPPDRVVLVVDDDLGVADALRAGGYQVEVP